MTNKKPLPHSDFAHAAPYEFKGLTDWFEVFQAGTQVDSKGYEKNWTHADLDSIVTNHNTDQPAPLVVGHPKTNDPAYGWTAELKREGDLLLAKGMDIVPEFESAVEAKQYRNRSVAIIPVEEGYQLRHIGFLGAVPPAVPGLKDIAFSDAEDASVFEFTVNDAVRGTGYRLGTIGRIFRSFKNWFIEKEGTEAADQMIPEYALEDLNDASSSIRADLAEPEPHTRFSSDPKQTINPMEDAIMPGEKKFSQQDLDDAVANGVQKALEPVQAENTQLKSAAETAAFNNRLNEAKTLVNGWINEGKILPASATGLAEFMASLSVGEKASFEFSEGEGDEVETKTADQFEFMTTLFSGLSKQLEFNKQHVDSDDLLDTNDATAIAKAAQEFADSEAKAGRTISIANAVMHVTQNGGAK